VTAAYPSVGADARAAAARAAAERLSAALERAGYAGHDPWDALSSPLVRRAARGRTARFVATNVLKRSPVRLRGPLGVPAQRHTKAVALLASAYARLEPDGGRAAAFARELLGRAVPHGDGAGFGYDFDVQTRWGFYAAGQPNAVVTVFAGHAFLDVEPLVDGDESARFRAAVSAGLAFARSSLLRERPGETFYAYHLASGLPIHNASLLVAALAARAGEADERDAAAVRFSLGRQRPDGSWPYGEGPKVGWVDGYHTAYVLEALARWREAGPDPAPDDALERGLDLFLARLIDPDGGPRATVESRFPLDTHAAASAITALCRLDDPRALPAAGRVLDWTLATMRRRDGRFAFQQGRILRNGTAYVRWNDAHMLLALANYAQAAG
jgi:hypothetical protein